MFDILLLELYNQHRSKILNNKGCEVIARSLLELKHIIMTQSHSAADWLSIDKEVDAAMKNASEADINEFIDSGAGEELDMTCSAIREITKEK